MTQRGTERCPCEKCNLTGIERERLENNPKARPDPALDGPAYEMGADLQDDGTVSFRPATIEEQINRLTAEDVWSRLCAWIDQQDGEVT